MLDSLTLSLLAYLSRGYTAVRSVRYGAYSIQRTSWSEAAVEDTVSS